MPIELSGACRCGAVAFRLNSHTPHPYQLCYCTICRKTAGGGGFAINIMGLSDTLRVEGRDAIGVFRAPIRQADGSLVASHGQRHFCIRCATALWLYDESWPDLIHPFASAIDTALPEPPSRVHILLADKPAWVTVSAGPGDECFESYPAESIEDWHRSRGLWLD